MWVASGADGRARGGPKFHFTRARAFRARDWALPSLAPRRHLPQAHQPTARSLATPLITRRRKTHQGQKGNHTLTTPRLVRRACTPRHAESTESHRGGLRRVGFGRSASWKMPNQAAKSASAQTDHSAKPVQGPASTSAPNEPWHAHAPPAVLARARLVRRVGRLRGDRTPRIGLGRAHAREEGVRPLRRCKMSHSH